MTNRCLLVRNGSKPETRRGAKSNLRVIYTPRPDATREGELAALAATYSFVIQAHERNMAATPMTKGRKGVNPEEWRSGQGH